MSPVQQMPPLDDPLTELTRDLPVGIVGRGRVGTALTRALRAAGVPVHDPYGREERGEGVKLVLLCVPDRAIADVARALPPGAVVGHCAASVPLSSLDPHAERFSLHPFLSVATTTTSFTGAACAVLGSTPYALSVAVCLARILGMHAIQVPEAERPLYHAAASMASNFLVTLEWLAERAITPYGLRREELVGLARSALEQWAREGASRALTGPIARGDDDTVARQRQAIVTYLPDALPVWDALAAATRRLAAGEHSVPIDS